MVEVPVCPCDRCGASLPLAQIVETASVLCKHCGATAVIDEDQRARVRAYVSAIYANWAKTLEEEQDALRTVAAGRAPLFLGSLCFTVLASVAFCGDLPVHDGFMLPVAGSHLLLVWSTRRTFLVPVVEMMLAKGLGACARCSGPVRFEEGAASASCRYCGASCLVNPQLKAQMIAAAGARLTGVVARREKAERAQVDPSSNWPALALIACVMLAFLASIWLFYGGFGHPRGVWVRPAVIASALLMLVWAVRGFSRMCERQLAFDAVLRSLRAGVGKLVE